MTHHQSSLSNHTSTCLRANEESLDTEAYPPHWEDDFNAFLDHRFQFGKSHAASKVWQGYEHGNFWDWSSANALYGQDVNGSLNSENKDMCVVRENNERKHEAVSYDDFPWDNEHIAVNIPHPSEDRSSRSMSLFREGVMKVVCTHDT